MLFNFNPMEVGMGHGRPCLEGRRPYAIIRISWGIDSITSPRTEIRDLDNKKIPRRWSIASPGHLKNYFHIHKGKIPEHPIGQRENGEYVTITKDGKIVSIAPKRGEEVNIMFVREKILLPPWLTKNTTWA